MSTPENDETFQSFGAELGGGRSLRARVREWFLVGGNRLLLAGAFSVGTFVLVLALERVGVFSVANANSMTRVASGLIAGTFSLVTLVVSVNQLILSQEFGAAGKSRERLEGVVSFRRDVADAAAAPAAPAAPTAVLEVLVETVRERAKALESAVEGDPALDPVGRYASTVEESADALDETLEAASFGTFEALSAMVSYDESWYLHAGTTLRNRHEEALSQPATERLDGLLETLELFAVAREHFKTTYLQRELTRFSQLTIYFGGPAILSAISLGLLYAELTGPTIRVVALPVVVSALIAVVVSPLGLLLSFILRTATVTRRTASVGPMIPQKDPEAGPFDFTDDGGDGDGG